MVVAQLAVVVTRFVLVISVLFFAGFAGASSRVIDDELVQNLRCDELSVPAIYRAIKSSAFYPERRVPIDNFSVIGMRGHCWAISRFQRMSLFFGRFDTSAKYEPSKISEIARGFRFVNRPGTRGLMQAPLTRIDTFALPKDDSKWFQSMEDALAKVDSDLGKRKLKTDLEAAQRDLFFRPENLQYITRTVTPRQQQNIFEQAFPLIRGNRLPMLIIRYSALSQHVVLARTVRQEKKNHWIIESIDSNVYFDKTEIHIELVKGRFKLTMVYPNYREEMPDEAIDAVFVAEESDRSMIDAGLLRHYTKACGQK